MDDQIGERFSSFLRREKITQIEFSRKTGINRGVVTNLANGRTREPKSSLVIALLKHYPQLNIRWLLLGEEPMYHEQEEEPGLSKEPENEYKTRVEREVEVQKAAIVGLQSELESLKERLEEIEKELRDLKLKH